MGQAGKQPTKQAITQAALSPSAFQAAVGEDNNKKNTFRGGKVFLFLLSLPEAGVAALFVYAWRNCTVTLNLQPSRQLQVRIATKIHFGGGKVCFLLSSPAAS